MRYMLKYFIQRPIAVIVSFVALLILGIIAFKKLPVSLLPNIDIPAILIRIDGTDLSSREIEDQLTKPLRSNLLQLKGLKHIESTSSEGFGTVRLEFEHGIDASMAFIEVNEKIDLTMNNFPKEISRPQVVKFSISDIPVFRLNIYPKQGNFAELGSLAREIIRRRIEQIPEVAMIDMTGHMQSQVEVIPKLGYLESLRISEETLMAAFRENTVSLGTILVKDGHYRYYLRFSSELQTLDALGKTPINVNGRLLSLSEIADINFTTSFSEGFYHTNGIQAINLAIIKQSSARMEDLKLHFKKLVKLMERDYPEVSFVVTQDQTELLDFSISNLKQDLVIGGILAFFLMLIFIRKIRAAILIGITIPLSLIISQLGFYSFGISLNIISLGGLILGLTMIIDNSIVVMDTIADFKRRGYSVCEAAVHGTSDIIQPLITSVLTNCAVFIPLIFLSGLAGAIFFDQAISIVIGVVSSLLVAIFLLPVLYTLVHKEQEVDRNFEIKTLVDISSIYDRILKWCFKFPILLTSLILLLIAIGIFAFTNLEKSRLPKITRNDFEVSIDWNEYLGAEESRNRVMHISETFKKNAITINSWSGPQQYLLPIMENLSYTQNRMYIKVMKSINIDSVKKNILTYVKNKYPLALIAIHPAKNAFDEVFSETRAPLRVIIRDKENSKMPNISVVNKIIDTLKSELNDGNVNPVSLYEKINLKINPDVAIRYGLSVSQISNALGGLLKNKKISDYQGSTTIIPLVLRKQSQNSIFTLLNENFITNATNDRIPFSALVEQEFHKSYKYITAGSIGEYYPVDIYSSNPEGDFWKVNNILNSISDKEVSLELEGSYFANKDLIKDMSMILIVSILLLYFILAAQFESLLQPLFILIELPIAIFGSFIFLSIAESSLNLMSMIGIVVMSGLIINDSILKIDAINKLRNKGVPLLDAIFEGGHKRIRSILMISLTSIGALAPTLFMNDLGSEIQKPLALALIGGMVVGLFVSLFFVPIVYFFIYKKKEKYV